MISLYFIKSSFFPYSIQILILFVTFPSLKWNKFSAWWLALQEERRNDGIPKKHPLKMSTRVEKSLSLSMKSARILKTRSYHPFLPRFHTFQWRKTEKRYDQQQYCNKNTNVFRLKNSSRTSLIFFYLFMVY